MRVFPFSSPSDSEGSSAAPSNLALSSHEQTQMIGFLQELVKTPSHSTHERAIADLIIEHLQAGGIGDVHVDSSGNVIARLGDGNGPMLLYDAHMDTVLAAGSGWSHDPYAAVIEDGIMYGLGTCDMKGSIASLVYAARRLAQGRAELHGNLILTFVVQEEPCEGCALKYAIEHQDFRPDWVVLCEPSDLSIMRGHRGRVLFKVTVHGRGSHASSPELGDNAIAAAARLIFGIDLLAADLPSDPFLGPGTIVVTSIESQAASMNAVPHTCSFCVDRRLTLGETATRAQAQIESVIQREGIHATVEVVEYQMDSYAGHRFEVHEAFNAWAIEENHPLIRAASGAIRAALGNTPQVGHWPFSTDGVYSMGEANIPTIGFGPGDPRYAHTAEEHVRLEDVVQAAHVYALLATMLLGS